MTSKSKQSNKFWVVVVAVLLLAVAGIGAMSWGGGDRSGVMGEFATYAVEQGPLTISVRATGSVRSAQSVTLQNETGERTTIVYLIREGTMVEEGDLLVELDSTELEEELIEDEMELEEARAELAQAQSALEVARQQAQADIQAAEVALELAELDLEKYEADGGDYELALRQAETNITLAEAELDRADEQLAGSERLFEAGYITETELRADQLTRQRRALDLEIAKGEKDLLERFTQRRTVQELRSARDQAEFELTKVEHSSASDIADAEARLRSRELNFAREEEQLARVKRQLEACTIRAPVSGMVVHGTSGDGGRRNQEPLAEGIEVPPRQDLIRLPTADRMVADIRIQEAVLQRVQEGMPVRITTDALPNQTFYGRISQIAVMPDAQRGWLSPDLKVYETEVEITGDASGLRSGMSCNAEIIVQELDDAMYVPLQAVTRVAGESVVYVPSAEGPQARKVEVGYDNNRMIQLVSGVQQGERVLLDPPLGPSIRPEREDRPDVPEREGQPQEQRRAESDTPETADTENVDTPEPAEES